MALPLNICTLSHLVKLEILQPKSLKKFNAFFIRCTAQLLLTNELFRIWLNCKIECLGEKKWPDALCANGQCHAHYSDIFDKTPYSKFLNYIRRFKAKSFPSISYYFHIPKIFLNFFPHTGKNRNRQKSNLLP